MTNHEILLQNKQMYSEMIRPDFSYDNDGYIIFKINYEYVETTSMLSYNNTNFYEKNIIILGSLILNKDSYDHYLVYFDPLIYYENAPLKVKIIYLHHLLV